MEHIELEIARRLRERQPYNVIAEDLRVSTKTIAKVSKMIKSGAIKFDEDGEPYYVSNSELDSISEKEDVMPVVYKIMRGLGVEDPKEALEEAYRFIIKLNPYMIYYGVETPEDLINFFEDQIRSLKDELQKYQNEIFLAKKLGISDKTLKYYEWFLKRYRGEWSGKLSDFLNDSAEYLAMKARENLKEYVL